MSNHERFLHHLTESESMRWRVAQYLSSRGNAVAIPPLRQAPRADMWEGYADDGDLQINQRVEVKHLSVEFSGRHDWPYGDNFIVCAKHAFDRAAPKPVAFFIMSQSGIAGAIVKASSANLWRVDVRKDNRYTGVSQEFYFAPLDCVEWITL